MESCKIKRDKPKKKVHYGWVICGLAVFAMFVSMGLTSNTFSLYINAFIEENGFTKAQGASLSTLRCIASLVSTIFCGKYYEKLGMRRGLSLAIATIGAGFLIYSRAHALVAFYVGALICGLGYGVGTMVPITMLVNRWFADKQGFVLGFASAGSGLATILCPPLITAGLQAGGVALAASVEGAAIILYGALMALLLRNSPQEKGLQPYATGKGTSAERVETAEGAAGVESVERVETAEGAAVVEAAEGVETTQGVAGVENAAVSLTKGATGMEKAEGGKTGQGAAGVEAAECGEMPENSGTLKGTLTKKDDFLLLFATFLVGIVTAPASESLAVHLTTAGISAGMVTAAISVYGLFMTGGKFVYGTLVDVIGSYRANRIFTVVLVLGFLSAFFVSGNHAYLALLATAGMGAGYSMTTLGLSVWALGFYTGERANTVVRYYWISTLIGSLLFTTMPGVVADITGSYRLYYGGCILVLLALMHMIQRTYRKYVN